ncbi:MAG: hypothetical protein B6I38_02985 [Anaerolineaceae bacterium 4572_5.1]|nr:MAG: hypothetical protein B5M51_03700 [Anaerolinea sp. 4484_236]OQY33917.1 MAG: hypothetical protein B6I38_02985 [Anaerolineaceae bacterium 4572_5.1]
MPESFRMWFEIIFTLTYLIVLWILVFAMNRRLDQVGDDKETTARFFLWAFGLLAFGDSFHILGRVTAYALGGLDARPVIFGSPTGIVGIGALATSVTLTIFYLLMLVIWKDRFGKPYNWFGMLLFAAAAIRLLIMAFPGNNWQSPSSPYDWAIYRNIPFWLQGLGVTFLFWRDGRAKKDGLYPKLAWLFLFSFAFYTPVVLFARQIPMLGMLMLPKTLIYGIVAYVVYKQLFKEN